MPVNGIVTLPPVPAVTPSAMPPFGIAEIRKRTHAVQEVMRGIMKEGTHYGTIPGTPKPSLWKAGAEVLCMTFRLAPLLDSRVTVDDPDGEWAYTSSRKDGGIVTGTCIGFFEVEATCTIQGPASEILSRCSARCNNRENKYRSLSLFDIRNTVQKMAEKRAFVSAVLMATGASDIFTQDIEDIFDSLSSLPTTRAKELNQPSISPTGNGLSPKREAWLMRAGHEWKVPPEAMGRCLDYLRTASSQAVVAFFDGLSKRQPVFTPFTQNLGDGVAHSG